MLRSLATDMDHFDHSVLTEVGHLGSGVIARSCGYYPEMGWCHVPKVFGTVDMEKVSR